MEGGQLSVSGQSIRLRLTDDMKKWLFEKADKESVSVSHIMRCCLAKEMEKDREN